MNTYFEAKLSSESTITKPVGFFKRVQGNLSRMALILLEVYLSCLDAENSESGNIVIVKRDLESLFSVDRYKTDFLKEIKQELSKITFRGKNNQMYDLFEIAKVVSTGNEPVRLRLKCLENAKLSLFNLQADECVKYKLSNICQLSSKYEILMYCLLREVLKSKNRVKFEVEFLTLKDLLLQNKSKSCKSYETYGMFNKKILSPIIKVINENTDLIVECSYKGLRGKGLASVVILFSVKEKNKKIEKPEKIKKEKRVQMVRKIDALNSCALEWADMRYSVVRKPITQEAYSLLKVFLEKVYESDDYTVEINTSDYKNIFREPENELLVDSIISEFVGVGYNLSYDGYDRRFQNVISSILRHHADLQKENILLTITYCEDVKSLLFDKERMSLFNKQYQKILEFQSEHQQRLYLYFLENRFKGSWSIKLSDLKSILYFDKEYNRDLYMEFDREVLFFAIGKINRLAEFSIDCSYELNDEKYNKLGTLVFNIRTNNDNN